MTVRPSPVIGTVHHARKATATPAILTINIFERNLHKRRESAEASSMGETPELAREPERAPKNKTHKASESTPNSAAAERIFSQMKGMFGDVQAGVGSGRYKAGDIRTTFAPFCGFVAI